MLALLIVETFLATVLLGANLPPEEKIVGMWAGIGMFVLVVLAVYTLVWFKPSNLTFDKHAHLMDRGKIRWGTDQSPVPPEELFPPGERGTKP